MDSGQRKTTLITGASSGIGLELARQLENQHNLILIGRRTQDDVTYSFGEQCRYIQADFTEPAAAVEQISQQLEQQGITQIDHLVQCAGTGKYVSPDQEEPSEITNTHKVNLVFPVLLTRQLAPLLERSEGKVTFIGSVAHKGSPKMASYAASKAGINGFARSLQSEWRDRISVQVLNPGPTLTPMLEKAGYSLGWEKYLFVPVETMAHEVKRLMDTNKKSANIFALAKAKSLLMRSSER